MGNENSKSKDVNKNGNIPEKHENGSANGLSVNITCNGLEVGVNGETIVQQNGGPPSLNLSTETAQPDFVIIESDHEQAAAAVISEVLETSMEKEPHCQQDAAAVIPEVLETPVKKEEVKKSKEGKTHRFGKMFKKKAEPPAVVKGDESVQEKESTGEDQTDVSLPAPDQQQESSGEEAATMIVAEHREDLHDIQQKTNAATQTDKKDEANISTQTNDDVTTNTESPVGRVVPVETAPTEDSLNKSDVVIAEEVVEDTVNEEHLHDQTSWNITKAIMENNAYEHMVFRAEPVEVLDNFEIKCTEKYDPDEEYVNEPEPAAESESDPNKSITESEIVTELNNTEETGPLDCRLTTVLADCPETVFATIPKLTDFAAVNMSGPSVDGVITEDNGEGGGEVSADVVQIEIAEPDPNAVPPEAGEANGIPSLDKEPVTTEMETVSGVVCEEPNPTPANQDMPIEELSDLLVTEIIVKVEEKLSPVADDEPSEKCDRCPEEEHDSEEDPPNQLPTTEELPEDTLNSPDDEVPLVSIPVIIITTDEKAEISEDVVTVLVPETTEEAGVSLVIPNNDAEVIPEAVIDALSQELELCGITFQEPAVDNGTEEVIVATTFVALSGEPESSLTMIDEPVEIVPEEINVEAIDALSSELEGVPEDFEEDTVQESSPGEEIAAVADSGEHIEEKTGICEEAPSENTGVVSSEDYVEESDIVEEKTEVCEESSSVGEVTGVASSENHVEEKDIANAKTEACEESVTEEEVIVVASSAELVVESDMPEEKTELCEVVLEQAESTETPEEIPIISEESEEATSEALENILEPVVEAISEKHEIIGNIVEEPAVEQTDEVPVNATEDSEPCISIQNERVVDSIVLAEMLLKDADEEMTVPPEVPGDEPTDSTAVTSDEPVEEILYILEQPPETEILVVILDTNEDEDTDDTVYDTDNSGVITVVEENADDPGDATSDEPDCFEAVIQAIIEEIITEEGAAAECDLMTSEDVVPEIITETVNESSVNSTDSTLDSERAEVIEDNMVTSTDMEALLVRLQTACASVVAESGYRLGGLKMSSQGYSITLTIHVAPEEEQE